MAQQETRGAIHIDAGNLYLPTHRQVEGVRGDHGGRIGRAATHMAGKA